MLFVSKRKRFRLVLKPTTHVLDAYGQRVAIPGLTVEFINGRYETEDPEIIKLMLNNPFLNNQYIVANTNAEVEQWIAEHPEYRHEAAQMITGGIATINAQSTPAAVTAAQSALRDAVSSSKDIDSILEEKISAKLNPLLEKLSKLVADSDADNETSKAKRTFTCPVPGCGAVFRSGIELGEHKRTVHASRPNDG